MRKPRTRVRGLRTTVTVQPSVSVIQVAAQPDATLVEHCARWAGDGHVPVSLSTMRRALTRLGLPLKKRP